MVIFIFVLSSINCGIGGSKGIGFACASLFRQQGCRVVLVGRDLGRLKEAQRELVGGDGDIGGDKKIPLIVGWESDASDGVAIVSGDVSKVGEVEKMCKMIMQQYGPVDILVNSAGIRRDSLLLTADPVQAEEIIATNLFGTINMSRGVAKGMLRRNKARELGVKNIRVSAIAPGFIDTDMTSDIPEAQKEKFLSSTPLGRFGKPEEVAQAAVFLAQSEFITGQVLVVDGGLTA
ncbi:reductase [Blyttiomyces sp. JEL0837]|nr:reductase [Blyttiomyces sp. JEL0837]